MATGLVSFKSSRSWLVIHGGVSNIVKAGSVFSGAGIKTGMLKSISFFGEERVVSLETPHAAAARSF